MKWLIITYSNFFILKYQMLYYINEKKILKFENSICSFSSLFVSKFSRKACKCSLKYEIPSGRSKGKRTFCLFHQNVTLRITTFCYVVSRLVVCCTIKTKVILHRGRFIIQANLDLRNPIHFSFLESNHVCTEFEKCLKYVLVNLSVKIFLISRFNCTIEFQYNAHYINIS